MAFLNIIGNTSKNHTQQFLDHIPSIFSDICQFTIFNHTITANIIQVSKYSTSNSIVRLEEKHFFIMWSEAEIFHFNGRIRRDVISH